MFLKFAAPLFLGLFVLGGAIFKSTAPRHCATILPRDNLFVLTGDVRRIPAAIKILRRNPNARLHIIGAGAPDLNALAPRNMHRQISLESKSKTTAQNAVAIRKIAEAEGLDRIIVITTADHMNRATLLIQRQLPGIRVATCPVPLNGMPLDKRLERWTSEYIKYIGTLLGIDHRG